MHTVKEAESVFADDKEVTLKVANELIIELEKLDLQYVPKVIKK